MVDITFTRCKYEKGQLMFDMFTKLTKERTVFDMKTIWGSYVADDNAQKVTNITEVEARVCVMHNGDKVGESAVGDLTRLRKKTVINPFPEVVGLIAKVHPLSAHFSYSTN